MLNERQRNKKLILLIDKLVKENELQYIELLETMVLNDTESMQKSFKLMTDNLNINHKNKKSD